MSVEIMVATWDNDLAFDLMELGEGDVYPPRDDEGKYISREIPGGGKLRPTAPKQVQESTGVDQFIQLALEYGDTAVSAGVIAKWLWEQLKGRAQKVKINEKTVYFDEDEEGNEFKKIIERTIEKEQDV